MSDFKVVRSMGDFQGKIAAEDFDLIVTNTHMEDESVTPLLQKVRQGDLGKNPFVPMISLAWEPSVDTISHVLSGGVDVILTLPLTAEKVDKALQALVMRRKPFVVTSDYIGPDRRVKPRLDTAKIPMTVVPNAVKRKVLGRDDVEDEEAVLKSIYDQRVESYISSVTFAIAKICGLTGGGQNTGYGTMEEWLTDLQVVSTNLSYRIAETSYAHQSALCHALIGVTDTIEKRGSVDAADMELLQQIALALEIAIKKDDYDTVSAALNINKMIEDSFRESKPR